MPWSPSLFSSLLSSFAHAQLLLWLSVIPLAQTAATTQKISKFICFICFKNKYLTPYWYYASLMLRHLCFWHHVFFFFLFFVDAVPSSVCCSCTWLFNKLMFLWRHNTSHSNLLCRKKWRLLAISWAQVPVFSHT